MIKKIICWPDTRLQQKSVTVPVADIPKLKELIQDLWDTVYDAGGIGLAAIQVGVAEAVIVIDVKEPLVLINPEVVEVGGLSELKNEGCLSFPGIVEQVPRNDWYLVKYVDADGVEKTQKLTGLIGQCAAHEIDHCQGQTLLDRLEADGRNRVLKAMKRKR